MSTISIVRDGDLRRRELLQTAAALATVGSAALVGAGRPATAAPDPGMFAYVGAFTTAERKGHGDGINVYRMDSRTGGWTHVPLLSDIVNPSFLALDHQQRFLYSVHADLDEVSAYSIDKNSGKLTPLNKQSCGGKNPVYLTLDPSNRYIVTANYTAGSVGVVSVEEDGTLGPRTDLVTLTGETGPNPKEQAGSHPHDCPFDPAGRFVVLPDKGLEGAGPRHIAFHPSLPVAYVINELGSTMTTYNYDTARGVLQAVQVLRPRRRASRVTIPALRSRSRHPDVLFTARTAVTTVSSSLQSTVPTEP